MQTRKLGSSDVEASVVALGAWAIGGWMWGGTEESAARETIAAALDHGITMIDTAPVYAFGRSEEIVGRAIQGRRDQVVLATKCGLRWDTKAGEFHFYSDDKGATPGPSKYEIYRYLHPDSIRWELEQSLRRLQTDYIDLYQTHWQDGSTPIEDTMAALMKLKDEGKIRAIGASNTQVSHLEQYVAHGQLDVAQERFSMLDRRIVDQGLLDYCAEHSVSLLAYSPLEQGLLTGNLSPDRQFGEGDVRREKPRFSKENRQRALGLAEQLAPIAQSHGVTVAQLVIAWTYHQKGAVFVLCGGRTVEQALENAKAGDVKFSDDDLGKIDQIVASSGVE